MSSMKQNLSGLPGTIVSRFKQSLATIVIVLVAFLMGGLLLGNSNGPIEHADHVGEQTKGPEKWTCSMHPQIQLPKPGFCPICAMDLIPLESSGGDDLAPRQLKMSETARELARIQTTAVQREFAEAEIRMVGRITYDETNLAYITAWVPGRLDRLFADYTGITVSKGDHIVDIYSPELLAAQEELIQAATSVSALDRTRSAVLLSTTIATLEATRDKLRLYGLTQEQIDGIEKTGHVTDHLTLHAPIGGVVVHKDAREGMYVSTGTRIFTIADLTRLWVMFEAYESDLRWLKYGQRVEFTSPSFPGERFEAIVSFIDPLVNPKTRTVRVRAVVENGDRRLKPDMFVRGIVKSRLGGGGEIVDNYLADKWISPMHPEIVKDGPGQCDVCGMDLVPAASLGYAGTGAGQATAPLMIPASAPLITGKRAVVYVELSGGDGPMFEGREVTLGPRAGNSYIVIAGLNEGERVVTNGAFKIDSELQIQARPSMMSPAGGYQTAGHQHGQTGSSSTSQADHNGEKKISAATDAERRAIAPVYEAYFELQMALAKDDLESAKKAAVSLKKSVDEVDTNVFSRSGHETWMQLAKTLSGELNNAGLATKMDSARNAFFYISEAVIALQKTFGHLKEDYFLTHCPMARGGDGADWLQKEDIVWNSFYGSQMLRCGSIEKTLPATQDGK